MTLTERQKTALYATAIALATCAVYARTTGFEFVYDDQSYVQKNLEVQRGLSLETVRWAFTSATTNWHPLTWLSHLLDVTLFGVASGPMHAVNFAIHALNAVLLLLVLRSATGLVGPSAIVAAVFALHPTHVESVAWVAERKDVLSAFFAFASLGAYVAWTRQPTAARYLATFALFALGLASKPTLVTWPFVFLLVDHWPLERKVGLGRRIAEKLPFIAIAAASSVVTVIAQRAGAALSSTDLVPFAARAQNFAWAYFEYLKQFVWPTDLAVFYPHPLGSLSLLQVAFSGALWLALSVAAISALQRARFAFVGWFWFVGMLVPMIGLVQVGGQGYADRYSYLAQTGLAVAVVFGLRELTLRGALHATFASIAAWCWIAALSITTAMQIGVWKDAESLFRQAASVTRDNYIAETGLGYALIGKGRNDEAVEHLRAALRTNPSFDKAHTSLIKALLNAGRVEEAAREADAWSKEHADDVDNWIALATARISFGEVDAALEASAQVLKRRSDDADYWNTYGKDLWIGGRAPDALAALKRAAELQPSNAAFAADFAGASALLANPSDASPAVRAFALNVAEGQRDVGRMLLARNKLDLARAHFVAAIALDPGSADGHSALAEVYLASKEIDLAVEEWRAASKLAPRRADLHNNLGYAAMLREDWDNAVSEFKTALELDPSLDTARGNLAEIERRRASK